MTTGGRRSSCGHQAPATDSRFLQDPVSLVPRCCRQLHFTEAVIIGQCCSSFWIFKSSFPFKINLPLSILVKGSSVVCIWVVDAMACYCFPPIYMQLRTMAIVLIPSQVKLYIFKHRCSLITVIEDCTIASVKRFLDDKWKA